MELLNISSQIDPNQISCMVKTAKGVYQMSQSCLYNQGVEVLEKHFYKSAVIVLCIFIVTSIIKYILIKIHNKKDTLENNIIQSMIDNIHIIDYMSVVTYLGLIIWFGIKQGILF